MAENIIVIIPSWNCSRANTAVDSMLNNAANLSDLNFVIVSHDCRNSSSSRKIGYRILEERTGPLQAMIAGAEIALFDGADILAFIHDDVEVLESGWDKRLRNIFRSSESIGLAGFGGAIGLADLDIYKTPYDLNQLARHSYYSNMKDWQTHGDLLTEPRQVAVLDGFSLIFSRQAYVAMGGWEQAVEDGLPHHHMYDFWACCRMRELGYQVWLCPIHVWHKGGSTATSEEYNKWVREQGYIGDWEVHAKAHEVCYKRFRNVLPIRI